MLNKHPKFPGTKGPVVTVIMDGIGFSPNPTGNAVHNARTPVLDGLFARYPHTLLKAHGTAVGMPSDNDMGNSEVGHNAIGAGQVYKQGAALVKDAVASGEIFGSDAWRQIIGNAKAHDSTLHFIGLFSDGNVHAHIDHLKALILRAKRENQRRVRVHALLDGRDVPDRSALDYVKPFERFLTALSDRDFDAQLASGGGRMCITMDRYEADWGMVEKGWRTHVLGDARHFGSATSAIRTLREESPGSLSDQYLPPFVIAKCGEPVGPVLDNDSVVLWNFRGDRAVEITRAFEQHAFAHFDRIRYPKVVFAGMLQYDGDLKLPTLFLVPPPTVTNSMGALLTDTGVTQLAIAETQKFGHVTYFWNGNRSGKFSDELETYIEIPSDRGPFDEKPWMKTAEITDELIRQLKTGRFRTARVNYANGDMVGHTGRYDAVIRGVETVDHALGRLLNLVDALQGAVIITADHGNAEEMFELDQRTRRPLLNVDGSFQPKTSHSLNRVPCILYANRLNGSVRMRTGTTFGLSHLAATTVNLLGFEAPEIWNQGILEFP